MANLNSETILISPSYVYEREKKLHTRALACLAEPPQPGTEDTGAREWSAEIWL